ncbi:MAG TPA: PIG-L family deacetylase [Terrimicrobiaceae bacterium]|nr:PIG-L family deacetylase [Terrimicrobiaceae bacterium]
MKTFALPTAEVYVPDGSEPEAACARVTHLAIGAHQDDLEFMAFPGILAGLDPSQSNAFGGVVCSDGAGSSRTGPFAGYTDDQMRDVRREEQREAARIGRYAVMIQLDYPSRVIKDPSDARLEEDLLAVLRLARPSVVYAHQPADKHETHIAVLRATLGALRRLPAEERPSQLIGCEGWRGLDWMGDSEKMLLDVSGHDALASRLNGVFASQIAGGKRYDLAVEGRRRANATFFNSHQGDKASHVCLAMDLTPLIRDDGLSVADFATGFIDRLRADVTGLLTRQFGS